MTGAGGKWLDRVTNAGVIALVGCSIAVAFAIGAAMPADGGTQAATAVPEWRTPSDPSVFQAARPEVRKQRLFSTAIAPVGQGWG
jgi:hypothetical protein